MRPSSLFHLQRSLLHIAFFLGALVLSMIGIAKMNYPLLLALILVLFMPILIQSPAWLLMAVIALFGTELTLPILPASLSLHQALGALLATWLIVRHLILPGQRIAQPSWFSSHLALFLYILNLALIMIVRGTGMRSFGSEEWGGGKYFLLLISALLFWTAPFKALTERQWKWALFFMTAGYVLPFLAQWLAGASFGGLAVTDFVKPALSESGATTLEGLDLQTTLVRIYPLAALGTAIGLAALIFLPVRFPHVIAAGFLLLVAAALVGMAGYRSHFLILAGTVTLYSFLFRENRPPGRHLLLLLIAGATLWALLYLITPLLPSLIQRTLSIIPGLGIREDVQTDATNTVTWRLGLWRFCYLLSEPYRWIGRGFLFDPDEIPLFDYTTGFLYMYIRHSYHSGPLSLLIDTGIPGLVIASAFFLYTIRETRRLLPEMTSSTFFGRVYRVLFAYLVVQIVYFYAIIGDSVASVIRILFTFTLMKVLVVSRRAAAPPPPAPEEAPAEAPAPEAPASPS